MDLHDFTYLINIELKQTRLKKEHYLIRQIAIYKGLIKLSFSSIGQDKSKLQKQTSKVTYLKY